MIPVKAEQLVAAVGGELLTGNATQLIKNVTIDSREKEENALYKKRGFFVILSSNSCIPQELVTLHRPFPVMASFLPRNGIDSNIITSAPYKYAVPAAIIPAGPPPIMQILLDDSILSPLYFCVNIVFAPNILECIKSFADFLFTFGCYFHYQCVDKTYWGNERVHE